MPRALKISEASSLALHSMGLIAAVSDGAITSRAIAARFQVSEAHLAKVLQRLVRAGLLRSLRGPRGGFSLAREAEEITLLEIYEAIEGPLEVVRCLFAVPLCSDRACVLGDVIGEANEKLRTHLAETRLCDLIPLFRPAPGGSAAP